MGMTIERYAAVAEAAGAGPEVTAMRAHAARAVMGMDENAAIFAAGMAQGAAVSAYKRGVRGGMLLASVGWSVVTAGLLWWVAG
jgi:hypothetical protein